MIRFYFSQLLIDKTKPESLSYKKKPRPVTPLRTIWPARADRRAPDGNRKAGPRTAGNGGQDEDAGGATPGLPASHSRAEGEPLRQRRALQHAPNGCNMHLICF